MSEYIITEDEARNLVKLSHIEAENDEQLNAQIAAHEGKLGYFGLPEVVRCRDCKRFHPKEGTMFACRFEYGEFTQWRSAKPDGFCSWGERRDA